jgi:hypothetical protein
MTQQERDDLSIFLMSQDARIAENARRAAHFEWKVHEVMAILNDKDLTAAAKVRNLRHELGMDATNDVWGEGDDLEQPDYPSTHDERGNLLHPYAPFKL